MTSRAGRFFAAIVAVVFLAAGCGADRGLRRAKRAEAKGDYYRAWMLYQKFAATHSKHAAAPEAVFRAGWLAEQRLSDCHMASTFYQAVASRYPQSEPWARMAAHQQANCPDYYPLVPGRRWIEGDSESSGKSARIEIACEPTGEKSGSISHSAWLVRTFYAGDASFKTTRHLYKKDQGELREYQSETDASPRVILKWPLAAGTRWNTRIGDRVARFEIVAADQRVSVEAGEFENCLHVRWSLPGVPGSTNEYYAPGVGKILTAYAGPDGETRKTELISFTVAEPPTLAAVSQEK